jgi:hypothetical protein
MPLLSDCISLKRRYQRSINLERDLDRNDSLEGYVITPRSMESLERILFALTSGNSRAWTLTGAYGTGKSSFAHFLLSLSGPSQSPARAEAKKIVAAQCNGDAHLWKLVNKRNLSGFVRAVATAQREPISHTVLKALYRGSREAFAQRKLKVVEELQTYIDKLKANKTSDPDRVLEFVQEVAKKSESGLILVIDELGKGLEYSALRHSDGDLFLLQQLAELKSDAGVYILGLLHQSFVDYGQVLSTQQRNEWSKVQGRFEDIPFTDSAFESIRLISHAIDYSPERVIKSVARQYARKWHGELSIYPEAASSFETIEGILPIHPLAAIVLPLLCNRFAQNDRSLFTFLTSDEPHSFMDFLRTNECSKDSLPTLKLDSLYDYFVDVVCTNVSSRPHLSRWLEISGRICESTGLAEDELRVLKAIGILNLIASAGSLRASKHLIELAMCDSPDNEVERKRWRKVIQSLVDQRLVAHRLQLDELRIWEGSDFNIEHSVQQAKQSDQRSLDERLNRCVPLSPIVAQRHSFKYGTFRVFERCFVSSEKQLQELTAQSATSDGVIAYWVGAQDCKQAPSCTIDQKPIIVLNGANIGALQNASEELSALLKIAIDAPELQSDGVARREVRQRALIAKRNLDDVLAESFDVRNCRKCWELGEFIKYESWRHFVTRLSEVCDRVYSSSPILINELVNRRELTSQGAKARRILLEALLGKYELKDLGLSGYGPEVSMYKSVLLNTGIHRLVEGGDKWELDEPQDGHLIPTWKAIEDFCLESIESARSVKDMFGKLALPPYGLKSGVMPILLAAVLIKHSDDICIYKDGTFVPILGVEHFELLVKAPERFSVKHFVTTGLRAQVFKEIEELVTTGNKNKGNIRNASLLGVVKPMINFVNGLPQYTRKTSRLSEQSIAVRNAILSAKEPDELLFCLIPQALGLSEIVPGDEENAAKAKALRGGLLQTLRELQMAYEEMLEECQKMLCAAFRIEEFSCRQALKRRGLGVVMSGARSTFDSFVNHIIDEDVDDRGWLTRLLMIICDKPTENWRDEDFGDFAAGVGNFANRFTNFESLQCNLSNAPGEGYQAKKITLTQSSGKEEQKILWIDVAKEHSVNRLVEEIISEKLSANPELQDAVISKLAELLLAGTESAGPTDRRKKA